MQHQPTNYPCHYPISPEWNNCTGRKYKELALGWSMPNVKQLLLGVPLLLKLIVLLMLLPLLLMLLSR
jgi:hypothetical protein